MTAEVALLNKNAVVLAADSAVTLSNGINSKVFNSAKKIYTLGARHSIGVMIYANAQLMGLPWEVIIKEFRKKLPERPLDEFKDYIELFKEHIVNFEHFRDRTVLNQFLQLETNNYLYYLHQEASKISDNLTNHGETVNQEKFNSIFEEIVKDFIETVNAEEDTISNEYTDSDQIILNTVQHTFGNRISSDLINDLTKAILLALRLGLIENSNSGIVIAGYGENNLFPSIVSFELSGVLDGEVIGSEKNHVEIDSVNLQTSLIPFAQSEMVATIMNGIDPIFNDYLINRFFTLAEQYNISEEDASSFIEDLGNFQQNNTINPILDILQLQPVEEMATTAHTFVEITSFKRKIVNTLETVGGPIDVLAITKGDGPIWIERKFYFDINKNLDYRLRKGY